MVSRAYLCPVKLSQVEGMGLCMRRIRPACFSCLLFLFLFLWQYAMADYCSAHGLIDSNDLENFSGMNLVHSTIVTRHGDRTPITTIPGLEEGWNCDAKRQSNTFLPSRPSELVFRRNFLPKRQPLPGNCGLGQLTLRGSLQLSQIGQHLRERYISDYKLLSEPLDRSEIFFRSTLIDRTIVSGQSLLQGLFPTDASTLSPLDLWTIDPSTENLFPNPQSCPRLQQIQKSLLNSSVVRERKQALDDVKTLLQSALNMTTLPPWSGLFDVFSAMRCHGQPWPIAEEEVERILSFASFEMAYMTSTPLSQILGIGTLWEDMLQQWKMVVEGDSAAPKFALFSGHDSTLTPLLASLMQESYKTWPPYASHLIFELWRNGTNAAMGREGEGEGEDLWVYVTYNGQAVVLDSTQPTSLLIPWSTFLAKIRPLIPPDWSAMCHSDQEEAVGQLHWSAAHLSPAGWASSAGPLD